MNKLCKTCKLEKSLSDFHKDKTGKFGTKTNCKQCVNKNRALYYQNNKEKEIKKVKQYQKEHKEEKKKYDKEFYQKNRDKKLENNKNWLENNKEHRRKQQNEYCKKRKNTDVKFKLACNLRTRLIGALKNNQKSGSAVNDLGCSIDELKQWIEAQFYDKLDTGEQMSWDNYGKNGWHIDHVIPLNSFDLKDRKQFLEACHYTNLQPMWKDENRKKSDKIDKNLKSLINLYKKESIRIFNSISTEEIVQLVKVIFKAYENEKTIFAAGNGGSVSYIQNMVADFNLHVFVSEDKHSQIVPRNNFKFVNLCNDQAIMTGIGNDLGLEYIFSEQLKYQGQKNDLFFGISGSGNSSNILEAFKMSKQKQMKNILFTRNEINKCNEFADLIICPRGISFFPGQIGKNNINFHFEDILSKLTHIAVGLLKEKVHAQSK